MNWKHMNRMVRDWVDGSSHRAAAPAAAAAADADFVAEAATDDPMADEAEPTPADGAPPEMADEPADKRGVSDKVRAARRRVLLRKGARMYSQMGEDAGESALAMLDATGMVVSWHDLADATDLAAKPVVDHHVSQFYVPGDIASGLPQHALRAAAADGRSVQQGWRRGPTGSIFWGTTVIEALMLRDGRVQGFAHVTRRSQAPPEDLRAPHDQLATSSVYASAL